MSAAPHFPKQWNAAGNEPDAATQGFVPKAQQKESIRDKQAFADVRCGLTIAAIANS